MNEINLDLVVEQAVLGAILLERDAFAKVAPILRAADFYKPAHATIYQSCIDLREKGLPIDLILMVDHLRGIGQLEACGGAFYVSELTSSVSGSGNIEYHAYLLVEYAMARLKKQIGEAMAKGSGHDVFAEIDAAKQALAAISDRFRASASVSPRQALESVLDYMMRVGNGMKGIASGLPSLDSLTSGWCDTHLVIVAARPSMGKTAFMLAACRHAALALHLPTLIFSLEMSREELLERLAITESGVDSQRVRGGQLSDEEKKTLMATTGRLFEAPLYINDSINMPVEEMLIVARREVKEKGIRLIAIDYLQLMSANAGKNAQREQEISKISRSLKVMAKELRVPVIALSQLNRAAEQRSDKRPMLTDLRESGSIEQDADTVVFLHRPSYYRAKEDANGNALDPNLCEAIIAKQRNGPCETAALSFYPRLGKFTDNNAQAEIQTANF